MSVAAAATAAAAASRRLYTAAATAALHAFLTPPAWTSVRAAPVASTGEGGESARVRNGRRTRGDGGGDGGDGASSGGGGGDGGGGSETENDAGTDQEAATAGGATADGTSGDLADDRDVEGDETDRPNAVAAVVTVAEEWNENFEEEEGAEREGEVEADAEAKVEVKPEEMVEVEAKMESEEEAEMKLKAEVKAEAEVKVEAEVQAEVETGVETGGEPGPRQPPRHAEISEDPENPQERQIHRQRGTENGYRAREGRSSGGGEFSASRSASSEIGGREPDAARPDAQESRSMGSSAGAAVAGALSELRATDERGEAAQTGEQGGGGEEECSTTGPCVWCEKDDLHLEYCKETGRRQEVRCIVRGAGLDIAGGGGAAGPIGVLPSSVRYISCSYAEEDDLLGLFHFWLAMVVVGILACFGMRRRQQKGGALSLYDRRAK